jgi:hypothetical protein
MTFYKTSDCCTLLILSYLTRSDILTTRKVCKKLNIISNTPTFLSKIWNMLPYEKACLLRRTKLGSSFFASVIGGYQTIDKDLVVYFFDEQIYFGVWRQPLLQCLTRQDCQILRRITSYYPAYAVDPINGKLAICFNNCPNEYSKNLTIEIYQGCQKCCEWKTEFLHVDFVDHIQIYGSLVYLYFVNHISVYENGKYKKCWSLPVKRISYNFETGIAVAPSGRLYYWNDVAIWYYNNKGRWICWNYSIDISVEAIRRLVVLPNVMVVLFQLPNESKQLLQVFSHSGKPLFSIWSDSEHLYRFYQVENMLLFIDNSELVQYCLM